MVALLLENVSNPPKTINLTLKYVFLISKCNRKTDRAHSELEHELKDISLSI